MAKKNCGRKNQEIDFPKDCQGCAFLNLSNETCAYKKPEGEKTSPKKCGCH